MIREFFEDFTIPLLFIFGIVILAGVGIGVYYSNAYKYNCNLEYGPSLKTTLLINSSEIAYNPESFCQRLKDKMEQE